MCFNILNDRDLFILLCLNNDFYENEVIDIDICFVNSIRFV